jgi:ABC-type dipeptide/oligopeptide/nickel transport system permease component
MTQYGLDRPLWEQYLRYMWGVVRLDFGVPYQSPGETVLSLLADAWVPSLVLGGLGVLIGAPLGILLGIAAALAPQLPSSTTSPRPWRRWASPCPSSSPPCS